LLVLVKEVTFPTRFSFYKMTDSNTQRMIDNTRLLIEAQQGNTESFGQLYEQYAQQVYRYLYVNLHDQMDAEDLTEEVFLRAWKFLPNYRHQGVPFLSYLFQIARNALIDHYRRSKSSTQHVELLEEIIDDQHQDPSSTASERIEREEVLKYLDKLNEDYRNVLIFRFLSDLSPSETAVVMGKTLGAVRVLQHRALAALRKILEVNIIFL